MWDEGGCGEASTKPEATRTELGAGRRACCLPTECCEGALALRARRCASRIVEPAGCRHSLLITAGQGFVIRSLVRAGREERVALQVALRAQLCDGLWVAFGHLGIGGNPTTVSLSLSLKRAAL